MNHRYNHHKFEVKGIYLFTKREIEEFLNSLLFTNWLDSVSTHIRIDEISLASINYKKNGEPLFAKLSVKASASGRQITSIIFLRGGSVAILPILTSKETGKRYVVFTQQLRLPVGGEILEIPAGMLDQDKNFSGVAAKEFEEEVGIKIKTEDLIPLTPDTSQLEQPLPFSQGITMSPGACDETMHFYLFSRILPQSEIDLLRGKLTGSVSENEKIRLVITEFENALEVTRDSKFLIAYALMSLQGIR